MSSTSASTSPVSTPLFHAELLPLIRSVTICITLPTPSTPTTHLTLTSPTELLLTHNGTSTPLPLPGAVAVRVAAATLRASIPTGEKTLSYRLPVAAPATAAAPPTSTEPAENYVPWSAPVLAQAGKSVSLMCKACACVLVDGASVKNWKDLPSGNWAEMMEFWHCHKPGPEKKKQQQTNGVHTNGAPHTNGHANGGHTAAAAAAPTATAAAANGEGARYGMLQGGFGAEAGTVLVDLTYFLVAQTDCVGVQVVEVISHSVCFCFFFFPFSFFLFFFLVFFMEGKRGQKEGQ